MRCGWCKEHCRMARISIARIRIHKLRKQIDSGHPQRAVYELDLDMEALELKFYDTEIDHSNVRGDNA